jgi:hypothetical protein
LAFCVCAVWGGGEVWASFTLVLFNP